MDKCFFGGMGEWGNGGSLKLTSVGRSEPGLKRCGVDLGRFDTLRSDDDLDEVDLLGILVRCFEECFDGWSWFKILEDAKVDRPKTTPIKPPCLALIALKTTVL